MNESNKIILIDENNNGKLESDEVIGISEAIRHSQQETAKKADNFVKQKKLEIKVQKERIMDKSFEL